MMNKNALIDIANQIKANNPSTVISVHLFKSPLVLTPDITALDIDEADYTGYSALNVAAAGVGWDDADGNAVLSIAGCHFQPTGSGTTNVIYGWVVQAVTLEGGSTHIVAMGEFDPPRAMNGVADAIDFIPEIKVGQPI